jgi:uncharacterized protein
VALILDTGPLYAALDRTDKSHSICRYLLETTPEPLIVPSPVLVEVNQLVRRRMHTGVFLNLLDDIRSGQFRVTELQREDLQRVREICSRYADADVGFVDAAVLSVVERLNEPKLATLDRRHFGLLRPRHVDTLHLLPD